MGYNILIVDDSSIARSVIGKSIKLADIPINEIFYAANGQEGLQILDESWIDVVFADINMPVMSGIEMVERMSDNGVMDNIPVIIISTEGSETRIEQLKSKGVRSYIRKPFTPERIRDTINDVLLCDEEEEEDSQ